MSVPEYIFYNHTIHDVLANDQKAHLNLKEIANAVKKYKKKIRPLVEPMLDGQILNFQRMAKYFRFNICSFLMLSRAMLSILYIVLCQN